MIPPRRRTDVDKVLLGLFYSLSLFGTQKFSVPIGILVDRGVGGRNKLSELPAGRLKVVFVADPDPAAVGFRLD